MRQGLASRAIVAMYAAGCLSFPVLAHASETAAEKVEALKLITQTANELCAIVPLEGGKTELSLDAKAKVDGLVGKVTGVGAGGAAKYGEEKYKNVLQKDLAVAIKNGHDCKLDVLKTLVPKFLPDTWGPTSKEVEPSGADVIKTLSGSFEKKGGKWIEYPPHAPGQYFMFDEMKRDAEFIYLKDSSRTKPGDPGNAMLLRLPTKGGAVQWSFSNPVAWIDLTIAQPLKK